MNTVTVTADSLIVEPSGLDKLWSLTRRITVPLAQVRGATADPGATDESRGIRAPGLHVPGKSAGTFHRDGEKVFWNVTGSRDTVVIELAGNTFQRLILTVENPRAVVEAINRACSSL